MAIDFGLRRFREYALANPRLTVITDHKPLEAVFAETRVGSVRIERIKLRHQDLQYKVKWRAGKENPADYFSRQAVPWQTQGQEIKSETEEDAKLTFMLLASHFNAAIGEQEIRLAYDTDEDLIILKSAIQIQTPPTTENTKKYRHMFRELTITATGLIMRAERLLLPNKLTERAMIIAHGDAHLGATRMTTRMSASLWFPNMAEEIRHFVESCHQCQLITIDYTKTPLTSPRTPAQSWMSVSLDHFGPIAGQYVLVVTDDLSKYPVARFISSTNARVNIAALDEIYAMFGYPKTHRTDNGAPFSAYEFKLWSEKHNIRHITTPPRHPRANPAECFMKSIKKALMAAIMIKKSLPETLTGLLRDYRDTPNIETGKTPAAIMFRHQYRTDIQTPSDDQENAEDNKMIEEIRKKIDQGKAKRNENFNSKTRTEFQYWEKGQRVLVKDFNKTRKMQPNYINTPFQITDIIGSKITLRPEGSGRTLIRHESDIKRYFERTPNKNIKDVGRYGPEVKDKQKRTQVPEDPGIYITIESEQPGQRHLHTARQSNRSRPANEREITEQTETTVTSKSSDAIKRAPARPQALTITEPARNTALIRDIIRPSTPENVIPTQPRGFTPEPPPIPPKTGLTTERRNLPRERKQPERYGEEAKQTKK
jgi:transposase InsO family protein